MPGPLYFTLFTVVVVVVEVRTDQVCHLACLILISGAYAMPPELNLSFMH